MAKPFNEHILDLLRLSREMMVLADLGDRDREDDTCGVLYGTLRDAAYKLRREAEKERLEHQRMGIWDAAEPAPSAAAAARLSGAANERNEERGEADCDDHGDND